MLPESRSSATEQYWDLLVDRSYLGADDLLTEDPPLPNWPFEEYIHTPNQPQSQPYEENPVTVTPAPDCEDDGATTCSELIVLLSELGRETSATTEDVEQHVIVLEDDEPATAKNAQPCVVVLDHDKPTTGKPAGHHRGTMPPPQRPRAKKASESDSQLDKPRLSLPTQQPGLVTTARTKKQGRPQSVNTKSITSKVDAQAINSIKTVANNKKQPAKKMSIPGLGEFCLAVKAEPGQKSKSNTPGNDMEGNEGEKQDLKHSPTSKRTLHINKKVHSYLPAAAEGYDRIYHFEESRQQKMLICYIHAHPTSIHKTESQCVQEAELLRQGILVGKERNLREANPSLPFKSPTAFPDSRLNLQNTMGMIIAMQNKPKLGLSTEDKKVYDACLIHEMLKWEVEMMADVTRWCDLQRLERLKETSVRFRIRDGMYLDLEAMLSFPIDGNREIEGSETSEN